MRRVSEIFGNEDEMFCSGANESFGYSISVTWICVWFFPSPGCG
jgi:hypothetical protein